MGSRRTNEHSRSDSALSGDGPRGTRLFAWETQEYRDSRKEGMRKFLRPNLRLVSKDDKQPRKGKLKMNLVQALQGAKQVKRVYVEPYKSHLIEVGLDETGWHFKQHLEGITNKFLAFPRTLEIPLSSSLAEKISELRQEAWKKSQKVITVGHQLNEKIRGSNFSFHQSACLMLDLTQDMRGSYIAEGLHVKLPKARFNIEKRSSLHNAYFESHMDEGPVSHYGDELDYVNEIKLDGPHLRYADELDELKHIYKCFWYGATRCRRMWLYALYDRETLSERIDEYRIQRFIPYSGHYYNDQTILLEVGYQEIEISVERMYDWILEYRVAGKEYAIGDCEDFKLVLYSILLTEVHHRDPVSVSEGLRTGTLEDTFAFFGNLLSSNMELDHTASERLSISGYGDLFDALAEPKKVTEEVTLGEHGFANFEDLIDDDVDSTPSSMASSTYSNRSRNVHWWDEAQQAEIPPDSDFSEQEEEPPPDDNHQERRPNYAQSFRLRGWFEGDAIEEIPDGEPTPLEDHIDDGYDSDSMLPVPIQDEDKVGFIMVDPDQWRPMRSTVYRQLEYIWGIKPRMEHQGRKLSRLATRKTSLS